MADADLLREKNTVEQLADSGRSSSEQDKYSTRLGSNHLHFSL
jgi:hypothetical protein